MKCHNCGYESNEKYCQMCGTKMPDEVEQTAPEYEFETDNSNVTITPEEDGFTASFTGTPQSNTPLENNPYAQKSQPEPMQYNEYNNYQPQSPYSAPYPQQPQGYPVPPQPYGGMPVPQYNPEIPKKSNVFPIVITCIIIAIIVAGLVIGIFSAVSYNKTLIQGFIDETVEDTESDLLDSYTSTEDYATEEDEEIHKMGEYAEFENFKVTLKDVEQTDSSSKSTIRTEFTFEIENTSDKTISFYYLSTDPVEIYGDEFDYTTSEWLNEDINYDYDGEVKIKSGKKFEFSTRYAVPKDAENLGVRLNLSSSSDDYTDYYTTFSTEK